MQPSAQGIASLFMGNPGALAARVDQDRKSSPMGIPDDLRQLMALNIVTNETDAAKRQQAMNELQQMAPSGQPPTVADSVRQQAAQKLQARMMQQQMAGIPAGIPQPQGQPQGIDQAPVEFGMAGGGIVSFQEGGRYETPYDRMNRENREREANKQVITLPEGTSRQEADIVQMQNPDATVVVEGGGSLLRRAAEAYRGNVADLKEALKRGFTYSSDVEAMRQREQQKTAPQPAAPISRPTEQMTPQQMERFVRPAQPPRVERDRRTNMPMVSAAPTSVAEPQAAPVAPQFQDSITLQGVLNQAEAAKLRGRQEYEDAVGRPKTEALDRLMAEYERQKAAAQSPTGMAGLMEYLGQIAATPRGMRSFEAGAAGARGVQALERERAAQRAALTEKQIGLEQKRIDADRQYAKDLLGVGNAEYDRALRANLSLFEEENKTKRQAMSDASAMTREQFRVQAEKDLAAIRFDYERKVRAMPTAEERFRREAIAAYKKKHPDADDFTVLQAIGAFGSKTGGYESAATALRAATSVLEDPDSTPEEKAVARQTRNEVLRGMRPGSQPSGNYTPLPANATAKDLVVGTVYQTARGPAKWDGKQFMPI